MNPGLTPDTLQTGLAIGGWVIDHLPGIISLIGLAIGMWKAGSFKQAMDLGLQFVRQLETRGDMTPAEKKAAATAELQRLLPTGLQRFAGVIVEALHKEADAQTKLVEETKFDPAEAPAPAGNTIHFQAMELMNLKMQLAELQAKLAVQGAAADPGTVPAAP